MTGSNWAPGLRPNQRFRFQCWSNSYSSNLPTQGQRWHRRRVLYQESTGFERYKPYLYPREVQNLNIHTKVEMAFWYLPRTSTPTLLAIWWLLTVSFPRNVIIIFLSGFVAMFMMEYLANTRLLLSENRRLEEDVAKPFSEWEEKARMTYAESCGVERGTCGEHCGQWSDLSWFEYLWILGWLDCEQLVIGTRQEKTSSESTFTEQFESRLGAVWAQSHPWRIGQVSVH